MRMRVGMTAGWKGFGETIGGVDNRASGEYATTFGLSNIASGMDSGILGGHKNSATTKCETVPTAPKDSCQGHPLHRRLPASVKAGSRRT